MYIKRLIEKTLLEKLSTNKINILLGARQVGKTSILKKIQSQIKTSSKNIFLDLDIYENKQIFNSYTEIMKYLTFNGFTETEDFVLFLDEFHTVQGINKLLKNLYDNHPNIKIIATGSSSLEILKSVKESLAGRKNILYLYPLTFTEFLNFKESELGDIFTNKRFHNLPVTLHQKFTDYLKEFCIFGGYPEVALCKNHDDQKEILKNIFDLLIKKDFIDELKIKNPFAIINTLKYLAINTGQIINYNDICKTVHLDIISLKKYLFLLEETFLIKHLPPFFTNKNKEIVKSPKIYFHDMGARNYFLSNFTAFDNRNDNSFLLENFFFAEFLKKSNFYTKLKYWRDKNGRELDLILETEANLKAFEIKYKNSLTSRDFTNLQYFQKEYPNSAIYLINKNKISTNTKIPIKTYLEIEEI